MHATHRVAKAAAVAATGSTLHSIGLHGMAADLLITVGRCGEGNDVIGVELSTLYY